MELFGINKLNFPSGKGVKIIWLRTPKLDYLKVSQTFSIHGDL